MNDVWLGILNAFKLIFSLDADLYEIVLRSLQVTLSAVLIASLIGLPLGSLLAVNRFRFRRATIALLNSLMGLSPVVVGLMAYLLFSRSGPLGGFGRAICEVGAIMIVGGNIDHVTRVLTTAIALKTGKGDFALALGLGFILIGLAMAVNMTIHALSRTERTGQW